MAHLEHIEAIEKRLRKAADTLQANSVYAGDEYFVPVILILLRHAYSRSLNVKAAIETDLLKRGGKTQALTREGFSQKTDIALKPEVQFDYLVALHDSVDRAMKIIEAMESIEKDYTSPQGFLPRSEQFSDVSRNVTGQVKILREQKEELVQARDRLLPCLMSGKVAT